MARAAGQYPRAVNESRGTAVFSNVLVGVDGRQGGRDAIALARQLAAPGARDNARACRSRSRRAKGADRNGDSHKMLSDERAAAGIDAKILVLHGLVALTSAPAGGDRRYDLLVVGACHRGPLGRLVAGDHTIRSLKERSARSRSRPADMSPPPHLAGRRRLGRLARGSAGPRGGARDRSEDGRDDRTVSSSCPGKAFPTVEPIQHRWSEVAKQLTPEDLARLGGMDDLDESGQIRIPGESSSASARTSIS